MRPNEKGNSFDSHSLLNNWSQEHRLCGHKKNILKSLSGSLTFEIGSVLKFLGGHIARVRFLNNPKGR